MVSPSIKHNFFNESNMYILFSRQIARHFISLLCFSALETDNFLFWFSQRTQMRTLYRLLSFSQCRSCRTHQSPSNGGLKKTNIQDVFPLVRTRTVRCCWSIRICYRIWFQLSIKKLFVFREKIREIEKI